MEKIEANRRERFHRQHMLIRPSLRGVAALLVAFARLLPALDANGKLPRPGSDFWNVQSLRRRDDSVDNVVGV